MNSLVFHKQGEESQGVSAAILSPERSGHFPMLGGCYTVSEAWSEVQKKARDSRRYTGHWCTDGTPSKL